MNINNVFNINFSGKVEDKKTSNARPYLAPQKPDTFERTTAPKTAVKKDTVLDKISKMYNKMTPLKLDENGSKIISEDNLDENKVMSLVKDIMTSKTSSVSFERAKCDGKENYVLKTQNDDDTRNLKLLDKDLNVLEIEKTKVDYDKEGNPTAKTVMTNDLRTNTFCETKYDIGELRIPVMSSAVKIKRDAHNRLVRKETYEKSDVEGMFNVKYEFPNGKTRQISKATKDKKTGAVLIEKDMRSSDMTRTQYRYEDDPNGNRIVDYKITDANGKVLMNQSQAFEVLGDNKFRSSRNNKSYLIELDDKSNTLKVTDEKKNEKTEIKLKDYVEGNDKKIANMLKMIPGDELFNMKDNVLKIKEIEDKTKSYRAPEIDYGLDKPEMTEPALMYSSLAVSDDPFIFLHELGHAVDVGGKTFAMKRDDEGRLGLVVDGSIRDDKEFSKIYKEERKNFLKEFPTNEREHVRYFVNDEAVPRKPKSGIEETIAETNALLNSYQSTDLVAIRTQYLQQHFPKSIAYLSEKLAPTK